MIPNISRFGHHSTGFTSFYRISGDFTMVLAVEPPLLQRGTDRLFSVLAYSVDSKPNIRNIFGFLKKTEYSVYSVSLYRWWAAATGDRFVKRLFSRYISRK